MRLSSLAALFGCLLSAAPAPLLARSSSGLSVSSLSSGVRITMRVARPVYPKDSLVPVTVRVDNLSAQTIWLMQFTGPCSGIGGYGGLLGESPVKVLDASGNIIEPRTIRAMEPGPMPIGCSSIFPVQPGRSFQQRFLTVLIAPRIRAVVQVGRQVGNAVTPHDIWTPVLALRLTKGMRPRVRLIRTGGRMVARIIPGRRESGLLYYLMWEQCAPGSTFQPGSINSALWEEQGGHSLVSICSDTESWHAVAGWLDQPIATVNYPG